MDPLERLAATVTATALAVPFVQMSGVVREVAPTHCRVRGLSSLVKLGDRVRLTSHGQEMLGEVVRVDESDAVVKPFDTRFAVGIGMLAALAGETYLCPHPSWKGRVVNALGAPIDDAGPLAPGDEAVAVDMAPPPPWRASA